MTITTIFRALVGEWTTLLIIVLLIAIAYTIEETIRQWYRLRHIKGPSLAAFSNLWLVRACWNGSMHLEFGAVSEKYGSLARISPNVLLTSSPELLRRIGMVRTPYTRSDWFRGLRMDPTKDNLLSFQDSKTRDVLRVKMAAGYSGKENASMETSVDLTVLALMQLIEGKYLSTDSEYRPFDFGRKAQYFTLDVITEVAYGKAFGFLTTDSDVYEYIKTLEGGARLMIVSTAMPLLSMLLQSRAMRAFLPSDEDHLGFGKLLGIAKQVVNERFGPDQKIQNDMVGSFMKHGLTKDEIEREISIQILAGSDTSATSIRSTLLYIITNPYVLDKLRVEIDNAPISSPIQDSEAKKLPYLQAVIKEGLRIFPPVTGLLAKRVPSGGDTFNGVFLPEGTKIGYSAWGLCRDKKIWGEDANLFRPERWLEGSAEKNREKEMTLDLVFGYGRAQCLGKGLAMMELNKVFVELLRRFDISIVNPTSPWHSINWGLFAQSEMWMRATRRSTKV